MLGFVGHHIPGGVPPRTILGTGLVLAREGVVLPPANEVPGEVTGVTPIASSYYSAGAAWQAATSATGHRLEGRMVGQTAWEVWYSGPALTAFKSPLSAGFYEMSVVAYNGAVDGPRSAIMAIAVTAPILSSNRIGTTNLSPVSTAPFPVPFGYKNIGAAGRIAICVGHPFGPGDIPAGHIAEWRNAGGAVVPVQQSCETFYRDGSLKYAVFYLVPATPFAAGETRQFTIGKVAGGINHTPSATLATVAAKSNFRLELRGFELGDDVFEARWNDIGAKASLFPWGVNPVRGLELTASGPQCMEWRGWMIPTRISDGARHRVLRVDFYLRYWPALDAFEVTPYVREPHTYGAHPAGTAGPLKPTRILHYAELFDGATRLYAYGGPNDVRAVTMPVSAAFNRAQNRFIPAASQLAHADGKWGNGVGVGFTGADLPSGIVSERTGFYVAQASAPSAAFVEGILCLNRPITKNAGNAAGALNGFTPWAANTAVAVGASRYTPENINLVCMTAGTTGGTPPTGLGALQTSTNPAMSSGNYHLTDGTVTWRRVSAWLGTGGSGNVTVYPIAHCYAGGGYVGMDADCNPIWRSVGATPAPAIRGLPIHNKHYLMTRSRLVPSFKHDITTKSVTESLMKYCPGLVSAGPGAQIVFGIESPSDGAYTDRIGPLSYTTVRSLYLPDEIKPHQRSCALGLSWADMTSHFLDERSGGPIIYNHGPNGDGATYPGHAPCNPTIWTSTQQRWGSPAFGLGWPIMSGPGTSLSNSGYDFAYQGLNSGAHMPNWFLVPYLRTGHRFYQDMIESNAICIISSIDGHVLTENGKRYSGIFRGGIGRNFAWWLRDLGTSLHTLPAGRPARALLEHTERTMCDFLVEVSPLSDAKHLGVAFGKDGRVLRGFQNAFFGYQIAMHVWQGNDHWRPYLDIVKPMILDINDDAVVPGGKWGVLGEYSMSNTDDKFLGLFKGAPFATLADWIAKTEEHNGQGEKNPIGYGPYPAKGIRNGALTSTAANPVSRSYPGAEPQISNQYEMIWFAAFAMWANIGFPRAAEVWQQTRARLFDTPTTMPKWWEVGSDGRPKFSATYAMWPVN